MAAKLTAVARFVIRLFQTFYFSASWTQPGNKLGRWKVGPRLNSMKMHEVHEEDFRLNAGRHF